ncbi:MAG: GC-type dockerin domain-anchored protein [Phycisphaerales bacterium]
MRAQRSVGLGYLILTAGLVSGCTPRGYDGGALVAVPTYRHVDARSAIALDNIDAKQRRMRGEGEEAHESRERAERAERGEREGRRELGERMDEPEEAMRFFLAQRLGPGMTQYPIEQVQAARRWTQQRERDLRAQRGALPGGLDHWEPLGPGNIGGRTRAILINPVNPDIMYAGGVAGGVFKSTNGGASWNPTSDDLINIAIASMVMDPTNPDVIYAGTGEGFFNSDGVRGLGIFKTTDAGATWNQLPGTVEPAVPFGAFFRCNKLAISPNDHNRLYAATRTAVWTSPDGGATWEALLDNPTVTDLPPDVPEADGSSAGFTDIAVRQDTPMGQPDVIFACSGSFTPSGLYRSEDAGASWDKLGTNADLIRGDQGRMTISIAPSNNDVVYICMANNGGSGATGQFVNVFRSTNGGDTWEPRVDFGQEISPFLLSNLIFGAGCFGNGQYAQGWYDNYIRVDPTNPDVVWVGGVDIFRSDDGAQTFGIASYWWLDSTFDAYVHADQHELVFHPDYDGVTNTTIFSGSDGGIYRSDNALAATTLEDCPFDDNFDLVFDDFPQIIWHTLNNGYGVTQFYHGAVASMSDTFIGGAQDNGTSRVTSTGAINSWTEVYGGDGGYCAIDAANNNNMYAETQFFPSMVRSTDGGANWFDANNGIFDSDGLFINPFAIDKSMPNVLWSGGQRPWRTINSANSWVPAGPNFSGPANQSAIAIAPSNSNVVYYGFEDGYVARSANALDPNPDWELFDSDNGLPAESAYISSVAVDPADPDIAYATSSTFGANHIYKTTDGGQNWSPIDGDIAIAGVPEVPAHWIAVRPCDSRQLFVGTEVGLFASGDAGMSWAPANLGMANTVIESLDFRDDDHIVAFTHGRGAFIASLDPCGESCGIDYDGDTTITMDDVLEFITLFIQMNPSTDLAPPFGVWDYSDVLAFMVTFAAGCP